MKKNTKILDVQNLMNNRIKLYVFTFLMFISFSNLSLGQYTETFATADRGIVNGPCGDNISTNCTNNNFTGVNWTINGVLTGMAAGDYAKTICGLF
ncbi:hypothetical protein [Lutibacter sp. Hel_I_33_5]|uniref:hypothetical protein n=1 Tax=Lutibacter sp. Hel_I_33_5 TaxID=1566289 RepID=UPI0011A783A7|nr:hypothetical protein [Lutibacter sp. Hel_I_33_5]